MIANCRYILKSVMVPENSSGFVLNQPTGLLKWTFAILACSREILSLEEHEEACQWVSSRLPQRPWDLKTQGWAAPTPGSGRISLIAVGSRGDVQPVVALALTLQKAGFIVKMFVNQPNEELVRTFAVDVVGCPSWSWEDPVGMVISDGAYERSVFEGVMTFGPELILYNSLACIEAWVLEKRLGAHSILYSHQVTTIADGDGWRGLLSGRRFHFHMGLGEHVLEEWGSSDVEGHVGGNRPVLFAFSQEVAQQPKPESHSASSGMHTTGYWELDSDRQQALFQQDNPFFGGKQRRQLLDFLAAGPPPVYIGWGSMPVNREQSGQLAVRALMETGQRGIVLGGGAGLDESSLHSAPDSDELCRYSQSNVLWLQWAPHEWLLPSCCMAVHHGGCGTTGAALRAGLPCVVVAFGYDQHFWAARVAALGVGAATRSVHEVSAGELASAMKKCQEEDVKHAAAALGDRLRQEDGTAKAVDVIKGYLASRKAAESPRA